MISRFPKIFQKVYGLDQVGKYQTIDTRASTREYALSSIYTVVLTVYDRTQKQFKTMSRGGK